MAKQRKKFDSSLKLEVDRMIKEQGLSVQSVSENIDTGRAMAPNMPAELVCAALNTAIQQRQTAGTEANLPL